MADNHIPLLSIIIPVYNVEKYLRECIDSILAEEFQDYEIILIDDGSSDSSPQIADEYTKNDSRIKIIHQKNQGQMKATKRGIAISKAPYIAFIDSDDYISKITHKEMIEAIIKEDADIVSMAGVRISKGKISPFEDSVPAGIYNKSDINSKILPSVFMNHDLLGSKGIQPSKALKIFKRDIVENVYSIIPDDIAYGEDMIFSYIAIAMANKFVILPKNKKGYYYRLNPSSVLWVHKNNLFEKSMKIISFFRNSSFLRDNIKFQDELNYTVCFFTINAFLNEYLMKNKAVFKERKTIIKNMLDYPEFKKAVNKISIDEMGIFNKTLISLMKNGRLNSVCLIGIIIAIFRIPITYISQKFF